MTTAHAPGGAAPETGGRAWVTLLTDAGYLVGSRTLAASLARVGSAHPLVVMVTTDIDAAGRAALVEAGCEVRDVRQVAPDGGLEQHYANPRFAQVWTKLAVWGLTDLERVVFLDADMLVVAGMDELFDLALADGEIAACHACRCNPNRIASYPASWTPANCFYTHCRGLEHTEQLDVVDNHLNGGFLVLRPDAAVLADMLERLAGIEDLSRYQFAEQDFLNEYFEGRWRPQPWVYNALKTLPHQHPGLWDDAAVKNIHFIIDKPWDKRPDPEDRYYPLDRRWWDVAGWYAPEPTAG